MELLLLRFLVQQSPLVEVGSSLPGKSRLLRYAVSSQGDPVLSLGHHPLGSCGLLLTGLSRGPSLRACGTDLNVPSHP